MRSLCTTEGGIHGLRNAARLTMITLLMMTVTATGMQTARAQRSDADPRVQSFVPGIDSPDADMAALQDGSPTARTAASLTRRSRANGYNSFLRIAWIPPGFQVTTLGKPKAKRVFFTASTFLNPPATVDELVNFVGNYYHPGQDLAVMVCRPPAEDRSKAEPLLATWPKLLPVIKGDLGDCSASTLGQGEREICGVAERYQDRKYGIYAYGLRKAMDIASQLYKTPESQNALWDNFGIATAFSGLGFTVWGSSTPSSTVRLSTSDILRHSVVPEYVLKNVTLKEANCHCVQVPESEELHAAPVDPAVVWDLGGLDDQGACRHLPKLESMSDSP